MRPSRLSGSADLEALRESIRKSRASTPHRVTVSSGTCGLAKGSDKLVAALHAAVVELKLEGKVEIKATGCHGFCDIEPVVLVAPQGVVYQRVTAERAKDILSETVLQGKVIEDLLYTDPRTGAKARAADAIPFYKAQRRILTSSNELVDPVSVEDYLAIGGYRGMAKAVLQMTPDGIIAEVTKARLRGRGGAGFLTGKKWGFCRASAGASKYVICNADEGDPGAYMDRSLLEGNPHSVIEGMVIGAFAIGAGEGIVYVRNEYPMAVRNAGLAIQAARELGLLGKDILGSGFDFDLRLFKGAGAFVCGEETSLIGSIEGLRASPRQRPPFPAVRGLWGKPTNINNVETWANVPLIIDRGADWFAGVGTATTGGTKIFALVGKINNTGLVEVPMGVTLRHIVEGAGGGVKGGRPLKAVQTGGPSGGCLPASMLDLSVDYDTLSKAGSIMGSGGMIVMDDTTCMVDLANYFLHFTQEESCGKCVPCRLGTRQMAEILSRITRGEGQEGDLSKLESLAAAVKAGSLCGLGQTAPNPVLTTIRHFRSEYEAHIKEKRCPSLVCKALLRFVVNASKCIGCGLCAKACPVKAVSGIPKKPHVVSQELCVKCGACFEACPAKIGAVERSSGAPAEVQG
ncbi:MAG: NADH-quinone oxidoreductase subunit NuoF [Elusimicrobia bacterium]|nr:NADH-quinone oxidoreductase subunit NuoF [Elusimicrobiota bacterium]